MERSGGFCFLLGEVCLDRSAWSDRMGGNRWDGMEKNMVFCTRNVRAICMYVMYVFSEMGMGVMWMRGRGGGGDLEGGGGVVFSIIKAFAGHCEWQKCRFPRPTY